MKTIANSPLPDAVLQPHYDRSALQSRMVHIGFGAFHRAHQALLTDRVLNRQGGTGGFVRSACLVALLCSRRCVNKTIFIACWKKVRRIIRRS